MGEHQRKALAARSEARPARAFELSGDRIGLDGRITERGAVAPVPDDQRRVLPAYAASHLAGYVLAGDQGMEWFYGELPARWLAARGLHLALVNAKTPNEREAQRLRFMNRRATCLIDSAAATTILAADVAATGCRLVVSCEDDWWHAPPWLWPFRPEAIAQLEALMAQAAVIVVPSARLAEVVAARHARPIVVMPPTLPPPADWPRLALRGPAPGLRVGWVGNATHLGDLELLVPVVLEFLARRPDATFVIAGPGSPHWWARPHPRIERHPDAMRLPGYYRWVASLALDVFVCPLLAYPWNEAKPCLKPLEAAMLGLPVIASRVGSYAEDLVHEETALLVENTPEAWVAALLRLATDVALRGRLAAGGQTWAASRTIDSTGPLWAQLWSAP